MTGLHEVCCYGSYGKAVCTGVVPERWMTGLHEVCCSGSYDKLSNFMDDLTAEGYAGAQVMPAVISAVRRI